MSMTDGEIIDWLLEGDISIQYQTNRDLLQNERPAERKKIERGGWGLKFLAQYYSNGWGRGFYQPKWTSTHYTLLDLKNLNIFPENRIIQEAINVILKKLKCDCGGIFPIGIAKRCDVCVNGMFLNYTCYFKVKEDDIKSVVDFLLSEKMCDGGFNCRSNGSGAVHSSLHTTLSVLEGILEYERNGYKYRLAELRQARENSHDFILEHRLFRSHKTGKIIHPDFLKFHYPCRWHYDVLRAMDYFQYTKVKYDERMDDAMEVIQNRRTKEGQWNLAAKYPGETHFDMETSGKPSRWNTLRALRVLRYFNKAD